MTAASPTLEEDQEFHAWKLEHNKVYSSPEEEAQRKLIWLATRSRVLAHNIRADQGLETYRCGMNHLSDKKPEEICCCRRRPKHQHDQESDKCDSASNASPPQD